MPDSKRSKPVIVGLTGGIASGKSTVADLFTELGIPHADADVCAREVVEPGSEGLAAVADAFGVEVLDEQGRLDRAALRLRVFSDPEARRRLEALLHPRIRELMRERLAGFAALDPPPPYALAVIPLLIETGQASSFDRLLVVHVDPAVQIARIIARDGGDEAQARAILASQVDPQRRLQLADDVIDNSDGLEALRQQVRQVHERYLRIFASPAPG